MVAVTKDTTKRTIKLDKYTIYLTIFQPQTYVYFKLNLIFPHSIFTKVKNVWKK
jgi:hypothetical protein